MRIPRVPFVRLTLLALFTAAPPFTANADGATVYAEQCASCHGADGRAETPIGRALGIPSFEGRRFGAEEIGKLLRESESHASVDGTAIEGALEALVETLNALAGSDDA